MDRQHIVTLSSKQYTMKEANIRIGKVSSKQKTAIRRIVSPKRDHAQ